jgi:hypothetical protein
MASGEWAAAEASMAMGMIRSVLSVERGRSDTVNIRNIVINLTKFRE